MKMKMKMENKHSVKMKKAQRMKTMRSGNDDDIVDAVADCKHYADDAVYNSDNGYLSTEYNFSCPIHAAWEVSCHHRCHVITCHRGHLGVSRVSQGLLTMSCPSKSPG